MLSPKGQPLRPLPKEDTNDYDPDSSSFDEDDREIFYDSDNALTDDDNLFEENVDREVEFAGVGWPLLVVAFSEELKSICSSSDEEGVVEKDKYPVFNEKTDMDNPCFSIGMEFKTHVIRDVVKGYSIKWGRMDLVVGYMGVPKYGGISMTQHPQYVTVRNELGREMLSLVKDLLDITPTTSSGDCRPFVMETVKADDNAKLGKGPSKPAPNFIGNIIALILNLIGPKGLEFARYSLDYHTIRNYLYVHRSWGKQISSDKASYCLT
ncbi:coenzyme F420 hydrogenase family [Actinidia rufa]|uniref:Coenzyme F420 hydrogenase family n=1 Tax=Actinidia rufa TaxID=165716 RepID=A0A7J0E4V3_9ERIC|nr:coenzyme F420 hydrogenase family [Actinidia rufa]